MSVKVYRPDDPEFATHVRASAARGVAENAGTPLPAPFSPEFGDYIAGRVEPAPEKTMAEVKRATKDEVVELPDGRQIQIQAKGAPVVDETLAERERELVRRAAEAVDADPLREIQADEGTHALSTGAVPSTKVKPLGPEAAKK